MNKRILNKRGSVPMFVCAAIPAIVLLGGFTIKQAGVWIADARAQAAVDAGVLAGARDITRLNGSQADKDAAISNIKKLIASIYNDNAPGSTPLTENDITVNPVGADKVDVSATVTVRNPVTGATVRITKYATANPSITGLELALVFDVTLSMVQSDGTDGAKNRVQSARDAATTLLSILYNDNPSKPADNKKWLSNLFISVVPFNVAVNYGKDNAHFLSAAPPSEDYPTSWTGDATSWGGCAEMRPVSLLDDTPQGANGGLRRYYWPSTYNATLKYDPNKSNTNSSQPHCLSSAAYTDSVARHVCMGHNDWTAPTGLLTDKRNKLIASFSTNSFVTAAGLNAWATAHGPNMMCPPDTGDRKRNLTVLPLTRDRETVQARIDFLTNLPFSYGTNIASGLQAGWFTLSPNWRAGVNGFKGWESAEPPDPANDPRPALPILPLDYGAANMRKVMVVLTDGDNVWSSARDIQGSSSSSLVRPESRRTEGFYGSYGYLGADYSGDDRLTATSTSNGQDKINEAAQDWCAKIKASTSTNGPDKITIYTIGLGSNISSEATTVLRNCASLGKDGKRLYYAAPTASKLKEIFTAIGNELSSLRLTQ